MKNLINKGNANWKWQVLKRYWELVTELKEKGLSNEKVAKHINIEIKDDVEDRRIVELLKVNASYIGKITRKPEYRLFLMRREEAKNE